jgi:hypothetical protein
MQLQTQPTQVFTVFGSYVLEGDGDYFPRRNAREIMPHPQPEFRPITDAVTVKREGTDIADCCASVRAS